MAARSYPARPAPAPVDPRTALRATTSRSGRWCRRPAGSNARPRPARPAGAAGSRRRRRTSRSRPMAARQCHPLGRVQIALCLRHAGDDPGGVGLAGLDGAAGPHAASAVRSAPGVSCPSLCIASPCPVSAARRSQLVASARSLRKSSDLASSTIDSTCPVSALSRNNRSASARSSRSNAALPRASSSAPSPPSPGGRRRREPNRAMALPPPPEHMHRSCVTRA